LTGSASFKIGGHCAVVSRCAPGFKPKTPPREAIRIKSQSPFHGAPVMNVSPAVAEELSLDDVREGVVVASSVCSPTVNSTRRSASVRWLAISSQMRVPE
jgi:hypothetical protein